MKKNVVKPYNGPYIVIELNTPTTVLLKRLSDGKYLPKPVNVKQLKRDMLDLKLTCGIGYPQPIPIQNFLKTIFLKKF